MIGILYGALGVLLALVLLGLGFFAGWRGHGQWLRHTSRAVSEELSEQQRRELDAQRRAFDELMSYNTETAYGMQRGLDALTGGER